VHTFMPGFGNLIRSCPYRPEGESHGFPELDLAEIRDFGRPVGLLLVTAPHFVPDDFDPFGIVRRPMNALPSGGHLVLSHLNGEGRPEKSVRKIKDASANTPTGIRFRTRKVVEGFYGGVEIIPPCEGAAPGIVNMGEWGAKARALEDGERSRRAVCAVARKP
jgi:S-adenosyl methyltransferase